MATKHSAPNTDITALTLLAGAGHDLKQPIQSLLLLAHLMALTDDADKRKQAARSMETSLQTLQAMIGELTRLARFETGAASPTVTTVALDQLTRGAIQRHRKFSDRNSIRFAGTSAGVVKTDERLAAELIGGLLRHATALSKGGEILITIIKTPEGHGVDIAFDGIQPSPQFFDSTFVETGIANADATLTPGLKMLKVLALHIGAAISVTSASPARHVVSLVFKSDP